METKIDEVDCPKHGRIKVVCLSWRMQWYRCMACVEEEQIKAEAEGKKPLVIYD